MFTTSGTYPWSFVTHIFHNGQPSHGGDRKIFEVMTSTLPKGTIGSVASLLAATLYQGNPDRNHKLWNIVSSMLPVSLDCLFFIASSVFFNVYLARMPGFSNKHMVNRFIFVAILNLLHKYTLLAGLQHHQRRLTKRTRDVYELMPQ